MGRFILLTMLVLFANNVLVCAERDWEKWDKEDISQIIDDYWRSSSVEIEHRKTLAVFTKQYILPNEKLLEVGCGSGLVYNELVPDILSNDAYMGVDVSEKMLDIARNRYVEGHFVKDDLYGLSFPDNSYDIAVAFEVFGHIDDIKKPIQELFRTASRLIIFTVWIGPQTKIEQEVIGNAQFFHKIFTIDDMLDSIHDALDTQSYNVDVQMLSENIAAFLIYKS